MWAKSLACKYEDHSGWQQSDFSGCLAAIARAWKKYLKITKQYWKSNKFAALRNLSKILANLLNFNKSFAVSDYSRPVQLKNIGPPIGPKILFALFIGSGNVQKKRKLIDNQAQRGRKSINLDSTVNQGSSAFGSATRRHQAQSSATKRNQAQGAEFLAASASNRQTRLS